MGEKKAVVYSAEWCPWCHKAIDFLKEHGVKVEVRDVGTNPDYAREVQEKTGQSGIPVTIIGDQAIIGFNQEAFLKAIGGDSGEKAEPGEKKEERKEEEQKEEKTEKKEESGDKPEEKEEEKKKESDNSYV